MIEVLKLPIGFPVHGGLVPVGSRITCLPAPIDSDQDWLCVVAKWQLRVATDTLQRAGWVSNTEEGSQVGPDFFSFRKGDINLILTGNDQFF